MGIGRTEKTAGRRFFKVEDERPAAAPAAPAAPAPTASSLGARPTATTSADARARHSAGSTLLAHQLHARFQQTTSVVAENFNAFSGGDDHITREDLEKMRDGRVSGSTQAMRDQARSILESPSFMNALDVGAGRGDVDGKISRNDLSGAGERLRTQDWNGPTIGVSGPIDNEQEARTVLERYGFLSDTAAGKGGANGHASNDDVRALLNDPNIPDELRQAASFIQNGDVDLPGDGSSFFGTVTSPFREAGGWIGEQGGNVAGGGARTGRELIFGTGELSNEERASLSAAARDAATREAGAAEKPLNEQKNAHHTNTPEEMREALNGDYQWMEGDVRRSPAVMAHDWQSDNGLSLRDWLAIGKESGRGLKLDIKEGESIDSVIDELKRADIPQDRLILNADVMAGPGGSGRNVSPEDLQKLRENFPDAIIAIGAKTGRTDPGTTYTEAQVNEMIRIAEQTGGPIMFPLRAELVTPQIVERLSPHGDVAIWNDPSTYGFENNSELRAAEQRFRDMGVTGIIDLRP